MWILAGSEGMLMSQEGHMEISPSESWGSAAMMLRAIADALTFDACGEIGGGECWLQRALRGKRE